MATAPASDYRSLMISFLLQDFLRGMAEAAGPDSLAKRMKLEYELVRIGPKASTLVQEAFAVQFHRDTAPLVDWYLDFLSGRDAAWHGETSVSQILRHFDIQWEPTKARVLRTALLIEFNNAVEPRNSEIARFMSDRGVYDDDRGEFTPDGRLMAETFVRTYLLHEHYDRIRTQVVGRSYATFVGGILRACFAGPELRVPRGRVEALLLIAGDIGTQRKTDLEHILTAPL